MNNWNELTPEQSDGIGIIKNIVCAYCQNRLRHGCIEECAREGLYRNLEPMKLSTLQHAPRLPSMSVMMQFAPVTRIAMMHLVLHYSQLNDDYPSA